MRIVFGSDGIPFPTPSSLIGVVDLGVGFFRSTASSSSASVFLVVVLLWLGLEDQSFGLDCARGRAIGP